jgi:predicted PurR-regulated permease PerM
MTKNLVKIGVAVLTTLLVLFVLWQFRTIVAYVLFSLMLAAFIRPLFSHLEGRRFLIRLVWILLYVLILAGFGFILFIMIKTSATELQKLAQSITVQDQWTLPLWAGSSIQQTILTRLPSPSVLFQAIIGNGGELVITGLLEIAKGIGGIFTAIAIIVILSIYWGINQVHFERLWLSLLPSDQRKRARGIWRTIEPGIGGYIRGQLIQSLLAGVLLGLGYWLLGSPYPALLGLVSILLCLIPVVGAFLVILFPLIVGLFTTIQLGLLSSLFALVIMVAILIWVKPRLLNRRWDNPILTVILLIALADAFGIFGIILAPPLSVVCQILWSRLVSHRSVAGASTNISDLTGRLTKVRETVSAMEGSQLPLLKNSLERISKLLTEAEPLLVAAFPVEASESLLNTGRDGEK